MLKSLIRHSLRAAGFDVVRRTVDRTPELQLAKLLGDLEIEVLFDIGANVGQFARTTRQCGYAGKVVSFEPLGEAHAQLLRAAAGDPLWQVHPRCAIGARADVLSINVAGNSVSSSLLPMESAHVDAAPASAVTGVEEVAVTTLDAVVPGYLPSPTAQFFLKIDTQGYEWEVLQGGHRTLQEARGLVVEMSLVPLYSGQRLWRDVIDELESRGFDLWAIQPGFTDPESGRTLQVDAVFRARAGAGHSAGNRASR